MRISSDESSMDQFGRICHDGELFSGELEAKSGDGQLLELSTYYEGIEHGPQAEWWPNGQKRSEGISKMGKAVGEWREWRSDGQLVEHAVFNDNGWEMERKRWDRDGNLVEDSKTR